MKVRSTLIIAIFLFSAACLALFANALPQAQNATPSDIARRIGAIKSINGNALTLAPESGAEVTVTVAPNARMLRIAPGAKDLKDATPVQLQELQVGDTIRVRGHASEDGKSLTALEVIVITRSTVAAVSEQIKQDWQKRGVGGVVDSVDTANGMVSISIPGLVSKRTILIHTAKNTVIRRYAPDSAKPEDAKPITLQGIQAGDQLRARGNRNADGSEVTAEEILTGVFPQLAATVKAVDASTGTLSVQDLKSKKSIDLKVSADSQLHKVPAEMAQRMGMMLKMAKAGALPSAGSSTSSPASGGASTAVGSPGSGATANGSGGARMGGARSGEGFQRMLDQTPAVTLADVHKGDAVVVLATEGTPSSGGTIIKLYSGVEPILEAAPNASQAMMLTPWSLGGGAPGGDTGNQ